jgi:hypothetical protein
MFPKGKKHLVELAEAYAIPQNAPLNITGIISPLSNLRRFNLFLILL